MGDHLQSLLAPEYLPPIVAGLSSPALRKAHAQRLLLFSLSLLVATACGWEVMMSSWTMRPGPIRIFRDVPSIMVSPSYLVKFILSPSTMLSYPRCRDALDYVGLNRGFTTLLVCMYVKSWEDFSKNQKSPKKNMGMLNRLLSFFHDSSADISTETAADPACHLGTRKLFAYGDKSPIELANEKSTPSLHWGITIAPGMQESFADANWFAQSPEWHCNIIVHIATVVYQAGLDQLVLLS